MVFRIAITNILEVEIAVEPREPTSGTEHQLGQRGVDIEVILAKDVVRGELPEVHLIEALLKVRNSLAMTKKQTTHTTWSGLLIL